MIVAYCVTANSSQLVFWYRTFWWRMSLWSPHHWITLGEVSNTDGLWLWKWKFALYRGNIRLAASRK